MRLRSGLFAFCALLLTGVFAWLGLSVPIHFRAVSPLVLAEAAEGTLSLEDLAADLLDKGETGPAQLVLRAASGSVRDAGQEAALERLLAAHPLYALSGGPAPYFEQWLRSAGVTEAEDDAVLALLLPADRREHLLGFLERSSNRTVLALLQTRALSGYERFLPVFSAAGHPLDATILATALLEQSGAWSPALSRFLRDRAEAAATADPRALAELEEAYLAVLSLGSRTNWRQLATLLETIPDLETLRVVTGLVQTARKRFPSFYAAALLSGDTPALARYLRRQDDSEGWEVMALALDLGRGALQTMASFDQPLYVPPGLIQALPLEEGQLALKGISEDRPRLALALKVLSLFAAGFFLALAIENLIRSFLPPHPAPRGLIVNAFHAVSGIACAALIWIASEPSLLDFKPNEGGTLRIQIANLLPSAQLTGPTVSPAMLDQVTLIVLLLFLVLQLLVFIFSMLKLREIRNQPVSAEIKIELLDNEENLFDLGLYVGLGGTVSSLVLVVMEFLDASLMAAYASTLFGIIFVAILKVGFLRPFKRRLIIEARHGGTGKRSEHLLL